MGLLRRIAGLLATVLVVAGQVAGQAPGLRAADLASLTAARESIQTDDLLRRVSVLASDAMEGREAGSTGGRAAGAYLVERLKKFGVAPAASDKSYYQEFGSGYRNVLAVLPGSDPELKNEYIIISAHYDHVGYGTPRNSLGPIGYIHNGADDNASGTSGLLELIEAVTLLHPSPKRSLLFAFWDAEEKGLLGSEHWVEHPTVPLKQVRLVLNADMIGRLRHDTVEISGDRTAAGLRRLVSEGNEASRLLLDFEGGVDRTSDHYSFYVRKIPALMLHTGKHEDYHRPSDDVDKLNVPGMRRVVGLLFQLVYTTAERSELPPFRRASLTELPPLNRSSRPRPRLGVSWDTEPKAEGTVKLTRVTAGSPAAEAGLQVGDRILEFAGVRLDPETDFRSVVSAAPSPVTAVVQSDGETESRTVTIQLRGQPRRVGIAWHTDEAEPGCVILSHVFGGSPAEKAGLHSGDRIYAVGNETIRSDDEFRKLLSRFPDALDLRIEHRGRIGTVHLKPLTPLKPPAGHQSGERRAKSGEPKP